MTPSDVVDRSLACAFIAAVGLNFINVIVRYGFESTILSAENRKSTLWSS